MKTLLSVAQAPGRHWVGDGFPVQGLFGYQQGAQSRSPFLMLDYAAPTHFTPKTGKRRGVGAHPHRGFETVTSARYQAIVDADIPVVPLDGGAGQVRVIAGDCAGHTGPARTFTPMNVWDVQVTAGHTATLAQPDGWTTLMVVLGGTVQVNGAALAQQSQCVIFSREGTGVQVQAQGGDARVLLLSGEPIDEPIVGYGPFVMNSRSEIEQAITDFNSGRFGQVR
jgi:redox-sensitive bicupin YhaK (pirin superfamily)